MKVLDRSSLEPPLDTIRTRPLLGIRVHYDLFNHRGSYGNIVQSQRVLEEKIRKEIPELSRLEFLEKILATKFALSDAENNRSGPLI